jgi:chemotaxis protein CheD
VNVCRIPITHMNDLRGHAEERVYLYPGGIWVSDAPALITTVLGSCVAVCLWSDTLAGINHFILPRGGSSPSPRYGNHALSILLERLIGRGAAKDDLYAAVFGGASVLGNGDSNGEPSLGRRNVIEAREFLARHDIPVIREDVGGHEGRKLTFHSVDGTTIVRKL